uniref:Pseudouridine synthase n=1 Tax=uncultured bacterium fosmid pJB42G5 TaxID=1478064 RepID=A0A0H3U7K1_9BACT|nr:putative ribosomal large subunit pseudouridine synthase B [uncultured bacterium fosmid pJB42G5]
MENNNEKVRRPRISRASSSNSETRTYGERRSYNSDNHSYNGGERRSYGDRKPSYSNNGESRSYGERRSYNNGEGRSYNGGERRSYGDRKPSYNSNGEGRSYGERRSFSSNGEGRSYGDRKPSYNNNGEGRSYGERRSFSSNGEGRSYGDRKPSYNNNGEGRSYGERRSFSSNGERRSFNGGERKSYGDRKPGFNRNGNNRGGNKPYGRKPFNKYDAATEGINKMISDRPQLDADLYSDNDIVNIPIKNEVRLNKYIANSGICSRREADNYILAGVVTVNGEVVTELGSKVNVMTDDVRFNGERLKGEEKVYIVMNKPKGYVTTASDPHAEKTVIELLKGCNTRVFAVGRLDKNTTGVLMFTNDGEIAEKLTHPSYDKKKIYQVSLDHDLKQDDFNQILSGITLTDGEVAADDLQYIDENDKRKLGIEIHSGKNRIVRRIFESLGYEVKGLDRVYFAGLTKKGIKRGGWRYLTEGEVNILRMGAYR